MSEIIKEANPIPSNKGKMKQPNKTNRKWSYMLRIVGRQPKNFPLDLLGEYLKEFADLLGEENKPTFGGVYNKSVGMAANIPTNRIHYAHARIVQAKTEPSSRSAKVFNRLQRMIDRDGIRQVQLLDGSENVLHLFEGHSVEPIIQPTITQTASIDGVVTGIVGADATMHLHLRDYLDRDIRILITDENQARELLKYFRSNTLRLIVTGSWKRTEKGWIPETSKCSLDSYEVLDESGVSEIFNDFAKCPENGWSKIEKPEKFLSDLRGEEE